MMTLVDPKIHYLTMRDAILALFQANKTALNVGLTGGTFSADHNEQIIAGDPISKQLPETLYPAIMVKLADKTETFQRAGNAGRKRPDVMFKIFGLTSKLESDPDAEIATLTDNIEGLLRNDITIGGAVEISDLGRAEFGLAQGEEDGLWHDIVLINLVCTVEVK